MPKIIKANKNGLSPLGESPFLFDAAPPGAAFRQYWFTQWDSNAAGTVHSAMNTKKFTGVREDAAPT